MVERRVCSFCGNEIEPGTGSMYIKVDGTVYNFCRTKCHKNMIELKRVPRRTRWTQQYSREKSTKIPARGKKVLRKRKVMSAKKKIVKSKSEATKIESEGKGEKEERK